MGQLTKDDFLNAVPQSNEVLPHSNTQNQTYNPEMRLIMEHFRRLSIGGGVLYSELRASVPNWSESAYLEMLEKGFLKEKKFEGGRRVFYTNAGLRIPRP